MLTVRFSGLGATDPDHPWEPGATDAGMATISGTSVSLSAGPSYFDDSVEPFLPLLQSQDGTFVGTMLGSADTGMMAAFDSNGNIRWSVPGWWEPLMATADGGVIAAEHDGPWCWTSSFFGRQWCGGSSKPVATVTFDQNGNATGQMASLPTYSWLGNAYQVGSVDQVVANPLYAALSFWAFQKGNQGNTGSAELQQKFPALRSCTDPGGNCQASLGPRDLLWNALQDLSNQLRGNPVCTAAAQQFVFSKLRDAKGRPITTSSFLAYLNSRTTLYDGSLSTLDYKYAKCGENFFRLNCNGNGLTVKATFEDTSGTTAITVTPSSPFKSFWKPGFTLPGPNDAGFGVGINPANRGVNISNESVLIHEALHGLTAFYEDEIQGALGSGAQPLSISIYIKENVLSRCPSFSGGGQQ